MPPWARKGEPRVRMGVRATSGRWLRRLSRMREADQWGSKLWRGGRVVGGEGGGVGAVVEGLAAGAGGESEFAEAGAGGAELGGEALAGDFGDPMADEGGLRGEAGDDGVGVLVAEGGGDGSVGTEVDVEFGALAENLAEILALVEDRSEEHTSASHANISY